MPLWVFVPDHWWRKWWLMCSERKGHRPFLEHLWWKPLLAVPSAGTSGNASSCCGVAWVLQSCGCNLLLFVINLRGITWVLTVQQSVSVNGSEICMCKFLCKAMHRKCILTFFCLLLPEIPEMLQSLAQRPAPANTNRERRPRYQHPKGAPNADLIFKTGGR